jgi:hypothetical protein
MKFKYKLRGLWEEIKLKARVVAAAVSAPWIGDVTPVGRLYVTKVSASGSREELGLVSTKVVTDAGVNYLVDVLQGLQTASVFSFHGSGTGTTAEAVGQTTLVTEIGSRTNGTKIEGASANIYRTVGTISYGGTFAVTEHGIFSASTSGTLLDRSVFAAINVINGDSIEFTYDLTLPSGS